MVQILKKIYIYKIYEDTNIKKKSKRAHEGNP